MHDRGLGTRERILDAAQAMIQEKGYNAVSFRDLAAAVKIKAASIHYYFPSKQDLVVALVGRYRQAFADARLGLDRSSAAPAEKLERYVSLLRASFRRSGRMCLCGILAAEASTLPRNVVESVRAFFNENESWLSALLAAGQKEGDMRLALSPKQAAETFFATLEGALMAAWTFKDEARIASAGRWLVESLKKG